MRVKLYARHRPKCALMLYDLWCASCSYMYHLRCDPYDKELPQTKLVRAARAHCRPEGR